MSSERKDEFLSWRGRLESPDGIPGQGLDHPEQAWERLMDRFREKPRRRRPVYWIAAACLLLAALTGSFLFHHRIRVTRMEARKQTTPAVVRPEDGPEVYTSVVPEGPGAPEAASTPAEARAGRAETAAAKRTGRGRRATGLGMDMKMAALTLDSVHPLEVPAAPLISQVPPVRPPVQKKWKVVDLDDLRDGWQAPHGMASSRSDHTFRIGFGDIDPPGAASGGSSPGSGPLIKVKLYTSN